MSVGAWVAICLVAGIVGALAAFLLTTWVFPARQRGLPELPPTAETFLPAQGIRAVDVENLRFHTEKHGYDRREVDWALAHIAAEFARLDSAATPSDKLE